MAGNIECTQRILKWEREIKTDYRIADRDHRCIKKNVTREEKMMIISELKG